MKAKLIGFVVLLVLLGVAGVQRRLIHEAQEERQRLQAVTQESSAGEPQTHEQTPQTPEGRRELSRLRNEVRQLRSQKPDLDRLRSDNERLAARIAEMNKPRQPPTEEQGFVLRQNWAPAGFGSPEAVVVTFFWAARQQDYQSALACMTAEGIEELMDKSGQTLREGVAESLTRLASVQGLRTANFRTNSEASFRIDVQSNPDGPAISFPLRHIDGKWKLDRLGR